MIVIVGASASGKSTLQKALLAKGFKKVVTYTTRPPRKNEVDGLDYHFISNEEFDDMLANGKFIEHAEYRGWFYGTGKDDCCDDDRYIAVLTPSGLRALKRLGKKVTSIYLYVDRPSLMINIIKRGDDIDEAYRRNLSDVGQFDGIMDEVDYVIDNHHFHLSLRGVVERFMEIWEKINERI